MQVNVYRKIEFQVILNNIHIRYEDDTMAGNDFNFGIRMESLSIQTTNSHWVG